MSDHHEGTTGATDRSTENLKDAARREYNDARERLSDQANRLKRDGGATIKTVVTDELDRRKAGMGAEIRTLAETLRHASSEQAEKAAGGMGTAPSSLLGQGADVLESLSSGLENHSVEDLTRSVSNYARANPAIFIGGCILAGLAVGRLLTASDQKTTGPASSPYQPGNYGRNARDDASQPPAYQAQQESGYASGQTHAPGAEPPIFGTPNTTVRDPSGASVSTSLQREDDNGL